MPDWTVFTRRRRWCAYDVSNNPKPDSVLAKRRWSIDVVGGFRYTGLPVSISLVVGGVIGLVGVDKLREIAIGALKRLARVNYDHQ